MKKRMVFLFLETQNGLKPTIQDENYWRGQGYKYTAYKTEDAITLAKRPMNLPNHAAFIPQTM